MNTNQLPPFNIPAKGLDCFGCGKHISRIHAIKTWQKNYRILCTDCELGMELNERHLITGFEE